MTEQLILEPFRWDKSSVGDDGSNGVQVGSGSLDAGNSRQLARVARPYQERITAEALELMREKYSCLTVMATGTGKTVVGSLVIEQTIKERNCNVLWTVGREELVEQAYRTLKHIASTMREQAFWKADISAKIVVASKDSLIRRLRKYPRNHFGLIVSDESHHAIAKSYRKIYEYFGAGSESCWHLGLTATPDRTDGVALGSDLGGTYASATSPYTITVAQDEGWLTPFVVKRVKLKGANFSKIHLLAGDLNPGELAAVMESERPLHCAAEALLKECGDRPTIVFCSSVSHAERLAEILCRYKKNIATSVNGETDKERRRKIFQTFGDKYQFLCNYGIATEGVDLPQCRAVAMLRPTKSRLVYTQMVGRGPRPDQGINALLTTDVSSRIKYIAGSSKPNCLLLDFVGVAGKHTLVSSLDVLGGRISLTDGVGFREEIEKLLENEPVTVEEAYAKVKQRDEEAKQKAAERAAKQAQADAARRAALTAKSTYSVRELDSSVLLSGTGELDASLASPTPGQVADCLKLGLELPNGCTQRGAGEILKKELDRKRAGLASTKQIKLIRKTKYSGNLETLTAKEASGLIASAIRRWKGWK